MSLVRFSMSLVGIAGLLAAVLAAATIWLLFTEPVTVADAVTEGNVTPLVRELAGFLYEAVWNLLRYLHVRM
jgi:multidrug resistance efflux pump